MKSTTITINQKGFTSDIFWAFMSGKGAYADHEFEAACDGRNFILYQRGGINNKVILEYKIPREIPALNSVEANDLTNFFKREWDKFIKETEGASSYDVIVDGIKRVVSDGKNPNPIPGSIEASPEERINSFKEYAASSLSPESYMKLEEIGYELLARKTGN